MAGEVIDEAYVEIKAKIDPKFDRDLRREVEKATKPIAADVERSLAPIRQTVRDSIQEPFEDAADSVRDSLRGVEASVKKSVRSASKDFDRFSTKIDEVEGELRKLRAEAANKIEADIDADTTEVDAKIRKLEASLRRLKSARADIEIDVDVDDAEANVKSLTAHIANLGGPGNRGPIDRLRSAFEGLGGSIGAFVTSSLKGVTAIAALSSTAMALGPILAGATAALTALIGAIGLAAGSLISLGGVLGSLGLAFAGVKIASQGVGDAIKAQSKAEQELAETGKVSEATQEELAAALKNLTPAARGVVKALAEIKVEFNGVRKALQESLFEGQGANLRAVADRLLPSLKSSLLIVTDALNGAGDAFTRFVTKGGGGKQITAILEGLAKTFRALLPAFGNIGAALLNVFQGSLGPSKSLAKSIVDVTERLQQWTSSINESGRLKDFLNDASEASGALLGFLGNLGKVLAGVFGAGAQDGVNLLQRMSSGLAGLSESIKSVEGQEALGGFFDMIGRSGQIITSMFDSLAPAIGGVFSAIAPALASLGELFSTTFASILEALQPAIDGLTPLFDTLASSLSALQPVFNSLGSALGGALSTVLLGLFDGLEKLIPPLEQFLGLWAGGATEIIKAMGPALESLAEAFGKIGEALSTALTAALPAFESNIETMTPVLGAVAAALADVAVAFADILVSVAPVIGPLSQIGALVLKLTAGPIILLAKGVSLLAKGFSAFYKFISPVTSAVSSFIGALLRGAGRLLTFLNPLDSIWKFLKTKFQPAFVEMKTVFDAEVRPALDNLANTFNTRVLPALRLMADFFTSTILPPIQTFVSVLQTYVWPAIQQVFGAIGEFFSGAAGSAITGTLTNLVSGLGLAVTAFDGLANGVLNAGSALVGFAGSVGSALGSALGNVASFVGSVVSFMASLPGKIISALGSLGSTVGGFFKSAFDSIRGVVTEGVSSIVRGFLNLADRIRSAGSSIFSAAKSVGGRIIEGIIAGLKATGSIASNIVKAVRDSLNSVIPSSVTVDPPGPLGPWRIPLPRFADGGIVDKKTIAMIGEAGKEVVVPVTRATRAASLVAKSGLADIPEVQRVILDRLRLSVADTTTRGLADARGPVARMASPALPSSTRDVLSRSVRADTPARSEVTTVPSSSKTYEDNRKQYFNLPPVDPQTLAEIINNRNDPSWSER